MLDASSDVTDTNGVAGINVFAGTTKGAGRITGIAQINGQDVEGSVDFSTLGDDAGTSPIDEYSLALVVRDINGDEQREISFQSPGQLVATLSRNGVPVSYERISFTLDGQGQINPSSGTALTNNSGEASVTVLTADTAGTAQLTATFELNGESLSENFNVQIVGDAPGGEGEVNTLTAVLLSSDTGLPTTEISAADPGRVEVTLVDTDSQPLAGKVVTFTSSLGSFLPMQATALTDTLGRANITITAGSVEGAGEITASYQGVDAVVGFVTEGDDIDPVEASPAISFEIYDCNDAPTFSKSLKNFEVCTVTSNITNERPGIVGAVVTRSGSTQPLNQVLVTGATTIGAITPASGTAITDEDGKAVMDVYADGDVGAGELSLKVQEVTSTKAFEIGRVDITLDVQTSLGTNTLPAGGSTIVEVTVFNPDGSLATGQPFSLELTSECVAAGTAVIDSPVVTTAGKGFSTYRADGCEGVDTITVSAITGSSTVTADASVTVDSVDIGSIQYVEANPVQMALRGTGGISGAGSRSETSLVSFKVLDATGQAAPQEKVCFELSTEVGGLTLSPSPLAADYLDCENMPNPGDPEYPADISLPNKYGVGYTNSEGLVTVTVNAGDVPTPVKVFAQWAGSDDQGHDRIISNTSEQLVVSTGITDANSFSLSANILNPEGWNFDGEEIDVTVRAADHFNNLVPAGTRISFRTEGGAIDASCETGLKEGDIPNGTCSVNWVSQNERPFEEVTPVCPNGGFNGNTTPPCTGTTLEGYTDGSNSVLPQPRPGRATITAYAIGEEGFVDLNGNGLYDSTDFRTTADDLGEAFTDHNEDGGYRNSGDPANNGDRDEEFIDYNIDGVYTAGDGLYTGLLCAAGSEAACSDTGSNLANAQLNVFANLPIVMAGSVPYLRLTNIDETTGNISLAQPIDLTVNASETVYLFVSDVNNNTLPFGTTIQASIDNGELAAGSDSSVTIGSNNSNRPLLYSFTVVREANPNQKTVGALVITIKTPQGELVSVSVTVVDAG
ncbi:MAG: invasin [Shewanella sp.]|nr:invasin [Shewanella sp.]